MSSLQSTGFKSYIIVWFGQLMSLTGTAMTRFALTIWAYSETNSATVLALMSFFSFVPIIVFSPIAGVLVDKWSRKFVMMLSDIGAGISTLILVILFLLNMIEIWHLYVLGAFAASFEAFQFPAFSSAITMMVKKEQLSQASGLLSVAQTSSTIVAPILATIVLSTFGLVHILIIDVISVIVAVIAIALVYIPNPEPSKDNSTKTNVFFDEVTFGFKYILNRPSLLGLQILFFAFNIFMGATMVLVAPLVLSSTDNNQNALAIVQSALGAGGFVGSLTMSTWAGPRKRVYGVFLSMIGTSLFGIMILGLGNTILLWTIGGFFMMFFIPIMNASNQVIWQSKVSPHLQGRVFSVRRLIAQITLPLAMIIAGPLVEFVFEPIFQNVTAMSPLVGAQTGSGISVLLLLLGLFGALTGLSGFLFNTTHNAEALLPNYDE
ncbi:MAG: MFS transporter [Chloroflexota bacterium]